MEYFLGLTFDPSSIHYTKVESFRRRYDSKFSKNKNLQLTILPPFTIDFTNYSEERVFVEELQELLEGHLYGLSEISQIEFNGINFSAGKKGVIALTPIISPDIVHCQESLYFFLKEYGVKFKNNKSAFNPLLPIGRFEDTTSMETAIETARIEFSNAFVMDAMSLVMFEKTPKEWKVQNNLFDFELRDHFFFVNHLYA
jgi:hypothetical protein